MKHIQQFAHYLAASFIVFTAPLVVWAQGDGKLLNPLADDRGLWELVTWLVRDILVGIIAPIAVTIALLWSGFQFIMAQGNSTKLEVARRNFLYVIAGAILLLGAYVILELVTNTVNEITR